LLQFSNLDLVFSRTLLGISNVWRKFLIV